MYTLITGASSGIGRSLAEICAKNGHNLILIGRNQQQLQELKLQCQQTYHSEAIIIVKDLSDPSTPSQIYQECRQRNLKVNILINNAGVGAYGQFDQIELTKQTAMINLNVNSLTQLSHLFLQDMRVENQGKIMNVASTAAFVPGPYMAVYYATKAYVLSLSQALAEELSETNITVTALCPGPTQSNFQEAASLTDSPLVKNKKLPTAQEVAEYGYKEMMNGTRVAIHGLRNKILIESLRISPRRMIPKFVKKLQKE